MKNLWRFVFLFFLGLFCLGIGQAIAATTYYVNATTGDDANPGTAPGSAFKTIQTALYTVSTNGDTIYVAAGTYSASTNGENFPLELSQLFPSDVSLIGDSPTSTIIDAEDTEANCIQNNPAAYITNFLISGFIIKGARQAAVGGGGYGISFPSGSYTIRNNIIIDNWTGIYIGGNSTIAGRGHWQISKITLDIQSRDNV